jgi:hypothetical protein
MTEHEETAAVETDANPKKLSAVGGFVGAALGSRVSRAGAVLGAVVGGTVGYLAGAVGRSPAETTDTGPVAIDVADDERGDTAAGETDGDDTGE